MIKLPLNEEVENLISKIIWFEDPSISIQNPIRILAYAMTYATHEDMKILRKYISDFDFLESLDKVPPGIVDSKSWSYWNLILGRYPAPPMPVRKL
jgi:hypothetical protein